jgi:hypothetical protein
VFGCGSAPGKEHAGKYGMPALWELIDSLGREAWPQFIRGDCNYGNEENMKQAEARFLETQDRWSPAGSGWEGIEGMLQLSGWSRKRRVVVVRRAKTPRGSTSSNSSAKGLPLLELAGACTLESATYEYIVLVTSLPYEVASISQLYRERADSENPFDELKTSGVGPALPPGILNAVKSWHGSSLWFTTGGVFLCGW